MSVASKLKKLPEIFLDMLPARGPITQSYDDGTGEEILEPVDLGVAHSVANMLTSIRADDIGRYGISRHRLVLDLDYPHEYVASSTDGHGHLVIDTELTLGNLLEILEVLSRHGIIESGFYEFTKARGFSSIRMPGQTKSSETDRWGPMDINGLVTMERNSILNKLGITPKWPVRSPRKDSL